MKIQVLGRGLIPRNSGIAPRKEPFEADLETIKAILNAGSFKVNMFNPVTKKLVPIDSNNLMKMWKAFGGAAPAPKKVVERAPITPASVPVTEKPQQPRPVTTEDMTKAINTVMADQDKKPASTNEAANNPNEKKAENNQTPNNNSSNPNNEKKDENKKDEKNGDKNNNGSLKPVNNPNSK